MMAMTRVVLLLLVVFKAAAVENSDSDHELFPYSSPTPSPLSYPPFPSSLLAPSDSLFPCPPSSPSSSPILPPYAAQEITRAECVKKCNTSCTQRDPFVRNICVNICTANKCPKAAVDDISCILGCAQSSTTSLRYDAKMMEEGVSSCYKQCKRD